MPIEWREQLNVGHPSIDADHRYLVDIINSFEAEAAKGLNKKSLSDVLYHLLVYCKEHFAREEAIQLRIGYPYATAHHKEHMRLSKALEDMARRYFVDRNGAIDLRAHGEITGFLRDWIVEHIVQQDLRMKPFIAAAQAAASKARPARPVGVPPTSS